MRNLHFYRLVNAKNLFFDKEISIQIKMSKLKAVFDTHPQIFNRLGLDLLLKFDSKKGLNNLNQVN